MSVALQCRQCGRTMYSTALSGLCPNCLFTCTTGRLADYAKTSASEATLANGVMIGPNGRFLLLDKLGEGGMGEVWLAADQELSRDGETHLVALKFLSESIRQDPQALTALRAEVLRSQALSHPNIVRIFDLHATAGGMPFIKMEFVEGSSLGQWLENRTDHVMPWRMVVRLTHQLCDALKYAHETVGIVHRDLKPSNLLLAEGPVLKLSDFGIAQAIHSRAASARDVVAQGTLSYASPQQIAGQQPTPADDVYALGATLYELLTGTPPFEGASAEEIIRKTYHETPAPIPKRLEALGRQNDVPSRLVALVQRCLEKDPIYRPKTREIAGLLPTLEEAPVARYRGIPSPQEQWDSESHNAKSLKSRLVPMGLFLAFLVLVGSLLAGVIRSRRTATGQTPPRPGAGSRLDQSAVLLPGPPTDGSSGSPVDGATHEPGPQITVSSTPIGFLVIRLRPTQDRQRAAHEYMIRRLGEAQLLTNVTLLPASLESRKEALAPGPYLVAVKVDKDWTMQESVEIKPNQTNAITFHFDRSARLIVTSDPSEAIVRWWDNREQALQSKKASFTNYFRSGALTFAAKARGYHETNINFHFNPAVTNRLHIQLVKSTYPLREEAWTNSLGMAFQWIEPLKLWACETEACVPDFNRFIKATGPHPDRTVWMPTREGWKTNDLSWGDVGPEFPQRADHPVVGVNWEDAENFCKWLTKSERETGGLTPIQA
ncbi:MAG: bifunctional serine/threonine-protein kinase/formylglycine-generating enzyme family protein, partial [Verrucomicrobiales bacterium]|nr:bifunctional serine/threonine-protein kinase/formylglycine-generating enzyme family protein [Verrucomicrobiales bacterium]